MNVLGHCTGPDLFAAFWIDNPEAPGWDRLTTFNQARWEMLATRLADEHRGAVAAIAAHRAAIESIGTVTVADDESRARAEAKQAADLALWRFGGR